MRSVFATGLAALSVIACTGDDAPTDPGSAGRIVSLEVSPDSATIELRDTIQFEAILTERLGRVVERPVIWTSLDTDVAIVDSSGRAIGVGVGATFIRATAEGIVDQARLRVIDPTGNQTSKSGARRLVLRITTDIERKRRPISLPERRGGW